MRISDWSSDVCSSDLPGPSTAYGVFLGVKAAIKYRLGADNCKDVRVAIQGVGSVGGGLARYLAAEGARLTIADINTDRARKLADETRGMIVPADEIMAAEADVFRSEERRCRDRVCQYLKITVVAVS